MRKSRFSEEQIIEAYGYSERRACQLIELNRRTLRRVPPDRDEDLRRRLRELAEERRRFGCPRLYLLLRREGLVVHHKRVERPVPGRGAVVAPAAKTQAPEPPAGQLSPQPGP